MLANRYIIGRLSSSISRFVLFQSKSPVAAASQARCVCVTLVYQARGVSSKARNLPEVSSRVAVSIWDHGSQYKCQEAW
jgi:hypothetical protein